MNEICSTLADSFEQSIYLHDTLIKVKYLKVHKTMYFYIRDNIYKNFSSNFIGRAQNYLVTVVNLIIVKTYIKHYDDYEKIFQI